MTIVALSFLLSIGIVVFFHDLLVHFFVGIVLFWIVNSALMCLLFLVSFIYKSGLLSVYKIREWIKTAIHKFKNRNLK